MGRRVVLRLPADGERGRQDLKDSARSTPRERRGSGVPENWVDDKKGVAITAFTDDGKSLSKLVVGRTSPGNQHDSRVRTIRR
jgi:hypothetical protein